MLPKSIDSFNLKKRHFIDSIGRSVRGNTIDTVYSNVAYEELTVDSIDSVDSIYFRLSIVCQIAIVLGMY